LSNIPPHFLHNILPASSRPEWAQASPAGSGRGWTDWSHTTTVALEISSEQRHVTTTAPTIRTQGEYVNPGDLRTPLLNQGAASHQEVKVW